MGRGVKARHMNEREAKQVVTAAAGNIGSNIKLATAMSLLVAGVALVF
jgi:hypothetical protein